MIKSQIPQIERLRKALRKYRFILLSVLTIIVGIGFILVFYLAPVGGIFGNISKDVGLALFTSGLIGLAIEYQTREQYLEDMKNAFLDSFLSSKELYTKFEQLNSNLESLKEDFILMKSISDLGIRNIYRNREQVDLDQFVRSAKPGSEIIITGVTLRTFLGEVKERILKQKTKEGCRFRILFLNPDSNVVKEIALEQERSYIDVKRKLKLTHSTFCDILQDLPEGDGVKFEIGEYDSSPIQFKVAVNDVMIACQYIVGKKGYDCPHLEIQRMENGIYELFHNQFEFIWTHRRAVMISR